MDRFTGFVVLAVVFLEPFLVALWFAVGSGRPRRSHFGARFLLAALSLPALMAVLVAVAGQHALSLPDTDVGKEVVTLLFFLAVVALMFVPGLLYRLSDPWPGPSESDGGGGGPGPPPPPPVGPRGDVPLPDADQARARVRDEHTPKRHELKPRRAAHEPRRTPVSKDL